MEIRGGNRNLQVKEGIHSSRTRRKDDKRPGCKNRSRNHQLYHRKVRGTGTAGQPDAVWGSLGQRTVLRHKKANGTKASWVADEVEDGVCGGFLAKREVKWSPG